MMPAMAPAPSGGGGASAAARRATPQHPRRPVRGSGAASAQPLPGPAAILIAAKPADGRDRGRHQARGAPPAPFAVRGLGWSWARGGWRRSWESPAVAALLLPGGNDSGLATPSLQSPSTQRGAGQAHELTSKSAQYPALHTFRGAKPRCAQCGSLLKRHA